MEDTIFLTKGLIDPTTGLPFLVCKNDDGTLGIMRDDATEDDLDCLKSIDVDLQNYHYSIDPRILCNFGDSTSYASGLDVAPFLLKALAEFIFLGQRATIHLSKRTALDTLHLLKSLHAQLPHELDLAIADSPNFIYGLHYAWQPRIIIWFPGHHDVADHIMHAFPHMTGKGLQRSPAAFPHYLRYHCQAETFRKAFIVIMPREAAAEKDKLTMPLLSKQRVLKMLYATLARPIMERCRMSILHKYLCIDRKLPQEVCEHIYRAVALLEIFERDQKNSSTTTSKTLPANHQCHVTSN